MLLLKSGRSIFARYRFYRAVVLYIVKQIYISFSHSDTQKQRLQQLKPRTALQQVVQELKEL